MFLGCIFSIREDNKKFGKIFLYVVSGGGDILFEREINFSMKKRKSMGLLRYSMYAMERGVFLLTGNINLRNYPGLPLR